MHAAARWCTLVSTAAALVAVGVPSATAGPTRQSTPYTARNSYSVGTVSYNFGDRAYTLPGTEEPVELAATVHYPKNLNGTPHPLIVALHGWHETCADAAAETARSEAEQAQDWDAFSQASGRLFSWPCPSGVKPIASDRGYDYLGEQLAAQGFVVVSIRANGINASSVSGDENASARADLINRHLALWQLLTSTGSGRLAGRFGNVDSGRPVDVDFAHHVDMREVGTLGHSRTGAGVTWQAADRHRRAWPAGEQVKAVLALAPAYNVMTEDMSAYRIDSTPLAVMRGTCDGQVGEEAFSFARDATAAGKADTYEFGVHGADHNYFNTQWSPQSGQVAAYDDAGQPQDQAGKCTDAYASTVDTELTEDAQRLVGALYVGAYFRRCLMSDTRSAPVLEGHTHPAADTATVDVKTTGAESRWTGLRGVRGVNPGRPGRHSLAVRTGSVSSRGRRSGALDSDALGALAHSLVSPTEAASVLSGGEVLVRRNDEGTFTLLRQPCRPRCGRDGAGPGGAHSRICSVSGRLQIPAGDVRG